MEYNLTILGRFLPSAFLNCLISRKTGGDRLLSVFRNYAGRSVLIKEESSRIWHQGHIDANGQFLLKQGVHLPYKEIRRVQVSSSVPKSASSVTSYLWDLPLREDVTTLNSELVGRKVVMPHLGHHPQTIEAFIHLEDKVSEAIYFLRDGDNYPLGNAIVLADSVMPFPIGDLYGKPSLLVSGDPNIVPFRRRQVPVELSAH